MSLECLPLVLRATLEATAHSKGMSPLTATTTTKKISESDLGTAYEVGIRDGEKVLNLFIKCIQPMDETFVSEGLIYFGNEVVFYGEILENFLEIERRNQSNINIPFTSVPKCINVHAGKTPFIILENLVSRGYKSMDVRVPLTLQCARVVLQQLGRFHAYSYAFKQRCPDAFIAATSKLKETVFREEMRPTYGKLFLHAIHDALKLAKQSLPKDSIYVEKLALFTLNIYDQMSTLAKPSPEDSDYYVITHGDLWPNNILCKFDPETGNPEDATFVDFQGCRYASPIHDLMLLILIGLEKTVREEFREDLMACYHEAVCGKLEELGLDGMHLFPFHALEKEMQKQARFALVMGLVGLPLFMNERSIHPQNHNNTNEAAGVGELIEFVQNVNAKKSMKCKNKMLEIIMDVVDQGLLD